MAGRSDDDKSREALTLLAQAVQALVMETVQSQPIRDNILTVLAEATRIAKQIEAPRFTKQETDD